MHLLHVLPALLALAYAQQQQQPPPPPQQQQQPPPPQQQQQQQQPPHLASQQPPPDPHQTPSSDAPPPGGTDFLYDNVPGIALDYKVQLDAGKEDCYYLYVHPHASFYVSFQVLRGGDGMAGFAVRQPSGQIVLPYQWRASAEYEEKSALGGYYALCLDNQFSRFAAKLVNFYVTTFRYDEWEKYTKEVENLDLGVQNVTVSLGNVDQKVQVILQEQHLSRSRNSRDFHLLQSNRDYVQYWSLAQLALIAATGGLQVFFLRRLFLMPNSSSKTRA